MTLPNFPFSASTLLLAAALLLIFGAVIVIPLFDRKRPALSPPTQIEALQQRRAEIVRSIRELDFDHKTHKLNDADHKQLRSELVARGAEVLRSIDALTPAHINSTADIDAQIEKSVADLRSRRGKNLPICADCGATLTKGNRFCGNCGAEVTA